MRKEKKDKHFIHKPIYEGGMKAMREFIQKHQTYPEEALKQRIEGTVVLRYTIDYQGKVTEVNIIKSLDPACDEEAARVVKLLKFQVPKNRQKGLKFHKRLQIHFRLPTQKPAETVEFTYTLTSSTQKSSEPKKDPKGGGYTIEVEW